MSFSINGINGYDYLTSGGIVSKGNPAGLKPQSTGLELPDFTNRLEYDKSVIVDGKAYRVKTDTMSGTEQKYVKIDKMKYPVTKVSDPLTCDGTKDAIIVKGKVHYVKDSSAAALELRFKNAVYSALKKKDEQ